MGESVDAFLARGGKINELLPTDRALEYGDYVRVPECNGAKDKIMNSEKFREKGRKGAAEYKRRMDAKKIKPLA
jgi:hypothetical protein